MIGAIWRSGVSSEANTTSAEASRAMSTASTGTATRRARATPARWLTRREDSRGAMACTTASPATPATRAAPTRRSTRIGVASSTEPVRP